MTPSSVSFDNWMHTCRGDIGDFQGHPAVLTQSLSHGRHLRKTCLPFDDQSPCQPAAAFVFFGSTD